MKSLLLLIASSTKSREQGIVLLLSLLISFIIAFALSVELLNTYLNKKNYALNQQQNELFYTLEKNKMWGKIYKESCLFTATFPNDYPLKLREKQIEGCTKKVDNITLHAVTEDLGIHECYHWYRFTLLGEDLHSNQMELQTVFTTPETRFWNLCKDKTSSAVGNGQQSWRIIF